MEHSTVTLPGMVSLPGPDGPREGALTLAVKTFPVDLSRIGGRLPPGPWNDGPGAALFVVTGAAADVVCIAIRPHTGVWNGYLGIPAGIDLEDLELDVHGGITYPPSRLPPLADSELALVRAELATWEALEFPARWVGFDTGHFGDFIPGLAGFGQPFEWKDLGYVCAELYRAACFLCGLPVFAVVENRTEEHPA